MRLSDDVIRGLKRVALEEAGARARLRLFGSRLDDTRRGGDVDLLLEVPDAVERPAVLAARVSARASRLMHGRKVDVVLLAPNLRKLPIHEIALRQGVAL
ncbi:MAG TPA: nucleotidyltransferase domain-containing protein [Nevskiaceae bacterium]|nr:nucleotidyltransferase domain-containing protein [Nevskiaceae bacterium]